MSAAGQLVAFEPVIDPATREYIHHLVMDLYEDAGCGDGQQAPVFLWAPGGEPFVLPADAGFDVGPSTIWKSIRLEVRYNNNGNTR